LQDLFRGQLGEDITARSTGISIRASFMAGSAIASEKSGAILRICWCRRQTCREAQSGNP